MKKNHVVIVGLITYAILTLMAIIYYKERTVFLDSAYHLFQMLSKGSFAIQSTRFPAALTQVFPVIALKMGLSLKAVAIAYSLSFVLFFLLTFLLTLLVLKNTRMALCILLFNILMVTHTFYWPHPELPAGIVFTLFYFSWTEGFLTAGKKTFSLFAGTPVFLVIIAFFHPLLLFIFFFMVLYLYNTFPHEKKFLAGISVAYILIHVLKTIFFFNPYDRGAMSGLKNILFRFPHYLTMQSNKNLVLYVLHDYYFLPLLLFSIIMVYIRTGAVQKLILVLAFFLGLCMIINLNYATGTDQFYIEAQYLLLSVFVIVPFVYEVLPVLKRPYLANQVIMLIAGTGLLRIWAAHDLYADRVDWYRKFMAKTSAYEHKKLILAEQDVPMEKIMITWGSAHECWLLSTLEQGITRSVIIEKTKGEFDPGMGKNNILITKWEQFEYKNLDSRYFIFNDTTFYRHY